MKKTIAALYERYCAHHDMDRPLLEWLGAVGCIAFPLFYLLRQTAALPELYDDLALRWVASALCLGLALRRRWPRKFARFYLAYSYAALFFSLSFLLSFTMLENQGGTPSVVNMVMSAIIIIMFADWRNAIVMLVGGYVASILVYVARTAHPHIPHAFVISAAGSVLVVIAGALSHFGQKRAEIGRMQRLYAGLAGSIAHEMRSPLAQVQYALDIIRERATSDPDLLEFVMLGQRAVRRGMQGIDLTLNQLKERTTDAICFCELSAAESVRNAVEEFAYDSPANRANVDVQIDRDFMFRGDETTLLLVLFNLLKNALYFLPLSSSARVTLRVETVPCHRIVVRDTGPGISAELQERLFEEFQTAGKADGTGLGLAFCKRAMRSFGGDITCVSRPEPFTEFILSFPPLRSEIELPKRAEQALACTAAPKDSSLDGCRVLVVDDSAINRKIARARLAGLGAHVAEASHAAEALRSLREGSHADVILMDMNMPGMSGVEATRVLRKLQGPVARTPVIILTADPTASARQNAFAAGANSFLVKPLEPDPLRTELMKLLVHEADHTSSRSLQA
jgi:signal transduction histidine kinase/ActR/RegA family two-component response regulator